MKDESLEEEEGVGGGVGRGSVEEKEWKKKIGQLKSKEEGRVI